MVTILIIILVLISVPFLFLGLLKLIGWFYDFQAKRKATKYCIARGYTVKKVEAFPNHYGLFFKDGNDHFYASFDFESNQTITWKKGSPEDKIMERRLKREKAKTQKKKSA